MEVSCFDIFLIDVWKVGFNVLIKLGKTEYSQDRQLKG